MEDKPWKCRNGHVLGQVRRNGSGIEHLLLYRHAVDMTAATPRDVDLIGFLEGTMLDIRCDLCGAVRLWKIGRKAAKKVVTLYLAE